MCVTTRSSLQSAGLQSLKLTLVGFQCWRQHGHHGGFAIASNRVFQHAGQFGVTVGDVLPSFVAGQCGNDVAQR